MAASNHKNRARRTTRQALVRRGKRCGIALLALVVATTLGVAGCGGSSSQAASGGSSGAAGQPSQETKADQAVITLQRPSIVASLTADEAAQAAPALSKGDQAKPSAPSSQPAQDLSNVTNLNDVYVPDEAKALLAQNGFAVGEGQAGYEFFELYEMNRYNLEPNFVTVDSMMHTYHLYFAHLQKTCERDQLSVRLASLSDAMLKQSADQYAKLKGTEWESAALRNEAFFAVASQLMGTGATVPAEVSDVVSSEVGLITAAQGTADSPLMGHEVDYSQFSPRGYYTESDVLERYFRTMMWYGKLGFDQDDEDLDRSALLITLGLDAGPKDDWEAIYTITGFFAGASDDCGYYEYLPAAQQAFGQDVSVDALAGNDEAWQAYHQLTATVEAPKTSSIGSGSVEDGSKKGFRFMGQRFTLDGAILSQLVYDQVGANAQGEVRDLPDALDVPAALGSDEALAILDEQGATGYDGYSKNLEALRQDVAGQSQTLWTGSLYNQWLYALNPLLVQKGEGYPTFMQSQAWTRKNLQTYLASYTELKHDTVLYAKQVMAEMGGGPLDQLDDRGYVEPEPEVFARLAKLTRATKDGLAGYGVLADADAQGLDVLASLADQLEAISTKELAGQGLTDDEYELIRSYGGQLEHLWDITAGEGLNPNASNKATSEPAAIVCDIATGSQGNVLQAGTGKVSQIYVIFPIDGELHVATGAVSSFYEFEQPAANRLTDGEWRSALGVPEFTSEYPTTLTPPAAPSWTKDFQFSYDMGY